MSWQIFHTAQTFIDMRKIQRTFLWSLGIFTVLSFETAELAAKIRHNGHFFSVVIRYQTDIFHSTWFNSVCYSRSLTPEQAAVAGKSPFNRKKQNQAHLGGPSRWWLAGERTTKRASNLHSQQTPTDTGNKDGNVTHPLLFTWRRAATERMTSLDSRCVIHFITSHAGPGLFKGVRADPDTAFR